MKYTSTFNENSKFETSLDGEMLNYPNISYIEETGGMSSLLEKPVELISFIVALNVAYSFQCEKDMTWNDFINSKYNAGNFAYDEVQKQITCNSVMLINAKLTDTIQNGYEYLGPQYGGTN